MPKQIKVIFVGDSGVGKTSVLIQGCSEDPFVSKIESTNMVDLYFKKVKVKDNQITISVSFFYFILHICFFPSFLKKISVMI